MLKKSFCSGNLARQIVAVSEPVLLLRSHPQGDHCWRAGQSCIPQGSLKPEIGNVMYRGNQAKDRVSRGGTKFRDREIREKIRNFAKKVRGRRSPSPKRLGKPLGLLQARLPN